MEIIYENIKFNENLSNGSLVFVFGWTDRWTDRHDEPSNCFSQFCNSA